MQSYDFLQLFKKHGCIMQLGGDDQWSNMLAGVELIRRKEQKPAYCMTCKLLTTSDGRKMGKTEKGALWLDPEKTSPYDFYQYWRNVGDDDVINCMKLLTFVPIEEIESMENLTGAELNPVKERLAFELTKMRKKPRKPLTRRARCSPLRLTLTICPLPFCLRKISQTVKSAFWRCLSNAVWRPPMEKRDVSFSRAASRWTVRRFPIRNRW